MLGDLSIYFANRRVRIAGQEVRLTATQYYLLAKLERDPASAIHAGTELLKGKPPSCQQGLGQFILRVERKTNYTASENLNLKVLDFVQLGSPALQPRYPDFLSCCRSPVVIMAIFHGA